MKYFCTVNSRRGFKQPSLVSVTHPWPIIYSLKPLSVITNIVGLQTDAVVVTGARFSRSAKMSQLDLSLWSRFLRISLSFLTHRPWAQSLLRRTLPSSSPSRSISSHNLPERHLVEEKPSKNQRDKNEINLNKSENNEYVTQFFLF